MKAQDLRAYGAILIFPLIVGAYSLWHPQTPGQHELATHDLPLKVFMAVTLACCVILLVPIRLNQPLYQLLSLMLAAVGGAALADAWLYSNMLAAGVGVLYGVTAALVFRGARKPAQA